MFALSAASIAPAYAGLVPGNPGAYPYSAVGEVAKANVAPNPERL
jgi:hypothetical protein